MKKMFQKLQDLGEKAARLQQAVGQVPAQTARLRETIALTAGQWQQIRSEVQSVVGALRGTGEDHVIPALREIQDHAGVFAAAGYQLTGVDLEVSPVPRLMVHLAKLAGVADSTLEALIAENITLPAVCAILAAIARADLVAGSVQLSELHYRDLTIEVGPAPQVRLRWRAGTGAGGPFLSPPQLPADTAVPPVLPGPARPVPAPGVAAAASGPRPSVYATSPLFGSHQLESTPAATAPPAAAPVPEPAPEAPSPLPTPTVIREPRTLGGPNWRESALDRFKNPGAGSKYKRDR